MKIWMAGALLVASTVIFAGCASKSKVDPFENYMAVASARQRTGDLQGSLNAMNHAIEVNPDSASALSRRGSLREEMGDAQGALADFQKAIVIDPAHPGGYLGRGLIRRKQSDIAGAMADFDQAIKLAPSEAALYLTRGETHAHDGDLVEGIADFSRAVELNPQLYRAFLWRAYALVAQEQYERAASDLKYVREHAKDAIMKQRAEELLRQIQTKGTAQQ